MDEVLGAILERCDAEPPVFQHDELSCWPAGRRDRAIDLGILVPAPPATALACDGCGGDHVDQIVYLTDRHTGQARAYLPCPACGPSPVEMQRLRRWRIDLPTLCRQIFGPLGVSGRPAELVPGRLWRLGALQFGAGRRAAFFGRRLHRRDAAGVLSQAGASRRSVVFSSGRSLPHDSGGPTIVPLASVVAWHDDGFRFDQVIIESELADVDPAARQERSARRRAARAADIEILAAELREHVRAARSHAMATRDRTGVPELLPRPTQEQLARRVDCSQYTVSRCLKDPAATELRFLWDLAVDLDRILYGAG